MRTLVDANVMLRYMLHDKTQSPITERTIREGAYLLPEVLAESQAQWSMDIFIVSPYRSRSIWTMRPEPEQLGLHGRNHGSSSR